MKNGISIIKLALQQKRTLQGRKVNESLDEMDDESTFVLANGQSKSKVTELPNKPEPEGENSQVTVTTNVKVGFDEILENGPGYVYHYEGHTFKVVTTNYDYFTLSVNSSGSEASTSIYTREDFDQITNGAKVDLISKP